MEKYYSQEIQKLCKTSSFELLCNNKRDVD